jgi:hypothetical protein
MKSIVLNLHTTFYGNGTQSFKLVAQNHNIVFNADPLQSSLCPNSLFMIHCSVFPHLSSLNQMPT